jgi:hypothetical protein
VTVKQTAPLEEVASLIADNPEHLNIGQIVYGPLRMIRRVRLVCNSRQVKQPRWWRLSRRRPGLSRGVLRRCVPDPRARGSGVSFFCANRGFFVPDSACQSMMSALPPAQAPAL